MAITSAICNSYKREVLAGTHTSAHTYKIALFTSSATLGAATETYSSTNEVANGNGYTTGGATLSGFSVTGTGATARLDFATPVTWPASTITARGALIYNSSASDKAVAVLSFGDSDIVSTAGTFTVTMPTVGDSTSLIRIS